MYPIQSEKGTGRRSKSRGAVLCFALSLYLSAGLSRGAEPNFDRFSPQGGQRGTEVDVQLVGSRLEDTDGFLFYRDGISVVGISTGEDKKVTAKFKIEPDCPLGQHPVRLRTKTGMSHLVTFWVSQYPNVSEAEPNSDFMAPQQIPFGSTVNGVVENEDVDYYVVDVKKGQRISAEVEALRLGGGRELFDPAVAILDARRFELDFADDTSLLLQDSYCTTVAPEDGKYVIMVREASYAGNSNYRYRLHVGAFPRPAQVFPAGGPAGQETEFTYLDSEGGEMGKGKVALPADGAGAFEYFYQENGAVPPSPNLIRVSSYPNVLEIEPNNGRNEATPISGELPVAFNGVISEDGDDDFFKFPAKKGQRFDFIAHARSIGSPLDPVINIFAPDGNNVVGNDDASNGRLDSVASFTAPADGEYTIRIRDHLSKGSPNHIYRIEVESPQSSLALSTPQFSQNDSQHRQMVTIPRGGKFATSVNIQKRGVAGAVQFLADNLPEGVTMKVGEVPDGLGNFPILFEAKPDAPLAATLTDLKILPLDERWKGKVEGRYGHTINLVQANPNNTVYYEYKYESLPVAVVEKVPFSIEAERPVVPLVQGGQMRLKVKVNREEGFADPLTIHLLWRPPGLGSANTINIPADQTEGYFTIDANGGARVGTYQLALMAESPSSKGRMYNAGEYVELTVATPYVSIEKGMASVELGKETDLIYKIGQLTPFEGKAKAKLFGLPNKVEAPEIEFTKDIEQIVFKIKTDAESPVGKHQQVFCQVLVPENGAEIQHSTAGGTIVRIDKPLPPKPAAKPPGTEKKPEAPKPPEEKKEEPKKPLSRLEQLRLRAKEGS